MWTELQAGIECLTQLLLLIDAMSSFLSPINSESDTNLTSDLTEASDLLRQQIIYNGDVLDISVEALQVYKEGVQSLKYLDASVRLAYSLLRMLERWAKLSGKGENGEMYVRKKKVRRRKKKSERYFPFCICWQLTKCIILVSVEKMMTTKIQMRIWKKSKMNMRTQSKKQSSHLTRLNL